MKTQEVVSANMKTYTTEEVSSEEDEENQEPCNRVSIFFVYEKDVDFDQNTAENANDNDVTDKNFFVTIFIFLGMIRRSSKYFYLF